MRLSFVGLGKDSFPIDVFATRHERALLYEDAEDVDDSSSDFNAALAICSRKELSDHTVNCLALSLPPRLILASALLEQGCQALASADSLPTFHPTAGGLRVRRRLGRPSPHAETGRSLPLFSLLS